MYNLRYHIASLVAVFLALALGLFLGAMVVDSGAVDRTSAAVIESLQEEYTVLRNENAELTRDAADRTVFEVEVVDAWASSRLEGSTVLVIAGPDPSPAQPYVEESLEAAGAAVATMRVSSEEITAPQAVEILSGIGVEVAAPITENAIPKLVEVVVDELRDPASAQAALATLANGGLIALEGIVPGVSTTAVVDVAIRGESPDGFALALARQAQGVGMRSFAASTAPEVGGVPMVPPASGLTTLNGVEGTRGRFAIVMLASEAVGVGSYGFDEAGRYILPEPIMR